jgi:hypothetical protein
LLQMLLQAVSRDPRLRARQHHLHSRTTHHQQQRCIHMYW